MQIQKIRNISAPKDNPESKTAPRLFKFQVTDGQSLYSAIEAETIQSITLNTVPGTKVIYFPFSLVIFPVMHIFHVNLIIIFHFPDFAKIEKQQRGNS